MTPLDLLGWVGAICGAALIIAVTAAIIVGCIRAIGGKPKTPLAAVPRPAPPQPFHGKARR